MSEELKPCPFCKGELDILDHEDGIRMTQYYAFCKDCVLESGMFREKEDAIAYANQRPIEDELRARVKELEEQVRVLEARAEFDHLTGDEL